MLSILKNRTYRHLFTAQVVALAGTGLATVALALLAYDLAGADAGFVLGTALAIKMIAYIAIAPIAGAVAELLPRRPMLVTLDIVRAAVAVMLPFVTEVWQIYVLIFVLQSASAAFTPTFQATIPDILPDERDYTKALSLSRLAYDLENILSPTIAAALLTLIASRDLFVGTALGFVASALLVATVLLPAARQFATQQKSFAARALRGVKIYLATPRLRGLMAVNVAVAASGSLVIVNTVVFVQSRLGLTETDTALALAAFGGGSMLAALLLPNLLEKISDRTGMLAGAAVLTAGALAAAAIQAYAVLLLVWFVLGLGFSLAQTPTGRLLRRSSHEEDRPSLFSAQFALSHAAWLFAYPLAGWAGVAIGMNGISLLLGLIALAATLIAIRIWPVADPVYIEHSHDDLDDTHSHWHQGETTGARRHSHAFVVDDLHPTWPY